MGLHSMPSEATIMRAFCVEASVEAALEACGGGLVKQHGLPPPRAQQNGSAIQG